MGFRSRLIIPAEEFAEFGKANSLPSISTREAEIEVVGMVTSTYPITVELDRTILLEVSRKLNDLFAECSVTELVFTILYSRPVPVPTTNTSLSGATPNE